MSSKLTRFVNNGAGLEKTLRLIQSVAQIAAVFTVGSTAVQLTTAKLQLALTRRFFRFFGFLQSFERVSTLLTNGSIGSVAGWIDLAKWTCFSLYFVLEDLTILHAMGVYAVPWEERVMREANTFWFFAISFSLVGSVYALLFSGAAEQKTKSKHSEKKINEKTGKAEKAAEAEKPAPGVNTSLFMKQIMVDGCDILLPVTLLGWYHPGDLVVGGTMVLSTLLTGSSIWAQV
ncbi:peroxin-11B Pex11B-Penicillium chrysogenum [Penicillium pulvis]|uniref:peroxin-11B Pex11B-Penicillium chrysogenum n=1 Tax=Penicillium pulvis TaxID=1562058 RepID=UPI002547B642|nr:peroxin-11B Pex11B-Penicillium chrysogenum [Penicillium pulvis]KAJ5784280.1 peroxin-11B Pex11B-Penicillium chrysogenum [Penicillium pulvis]